MWGTKILIPEAYALEWIMLQFFQIVLISLLEKTHRVVAAYNQFLTAYINRKKFFIRRLQRVDPKLGIARFLRYVQIVFQAWFKETWNLVGTAVGVGLPTPDLCLPLTNMSIRGMTWLPYLPPQYFFPMEAPSPVISHNTQS